jgi:DNA-binding transcriptional MerR regulator
MKISELSARTGVSIPTLKFYLREGLLTPGELSAPNQADYGEAHIRRAALIRALRDVAGLSIARIRVIIDALDHGGELFDVMGDTVDSLGGDPIDVFTEARREAATDVDRLLGDLGLPRREESLARHQLIAALASIREMLFPGMPVEGLIPYAQAALQVAAMEQAATPGMFELEPDRAIEAAVLGLALFEPVLVAFRRLAHERAAEDAAAGVVRGTGNLDWVPEALREPSGRPAS